MEGLRLLIFILPRGGGDKLAKLCRAAGISFRVILRGHGTADGSVLELMGIESKERDVALFSCGESRASCFLDEFSEKLGLDKPGGGIAMSLPVSAAAAQMMSCDILAGTWSRRIAKGGGEDER